MHRNRTCENLRRERCPGLRKLEARYEENKRNPQKKLGGLAGRLQAMQEQQERMQREREELARKRKGLGQ